jgi:hypothetical protein
LQNGQPIGQLQWDSANSVLTVTGSVFIDGSVKVTKSLTYTSTGILEFAGTLNIIGQKIHICAITSCDASSWQGGSTNNQMLTLAPLASSTIAVNFQDNNQVFQGSLWTQPSSSVSFAFNNDIVQGPISIGSIDATKNNANFQPLPRINNMPPGAPVPPNSSASVGPLYTTR